MNLLVTGGASGLGLAITKKLLSDSNNFVYFTYANSKSSADELLLQYDNAKALLCDFTNTESVESLLNEIEELQLDGIVHNAFYGQYLSTYFHKNEPSNFSIDFENNILPVTKITQLVIKKFRKQKHGKIITILTSAIMNRPPLGTSSYCALKAYMKKMMQVWATENAAFNIQSNAVSPTMMETSLVNDMDERQLEQIKKTFPLKRFLTVDEVAEVVDFLCHAPSYLNGVDIPLNSGLDLS